MSENFGVKCRILPTLCTAVRLRHWWIWWVRLLFILLELRLLVFLLRSMFPTLMLRLLMYVFSFLPLNFSEFWWKLKWFCWICVVQLLLIICNLSGFSVFWHTPYKIVEMLGLSSLQLVMNCEHNLQWNCAKVRFLNFLCAYMFDFWSAVKLGTR